MGKDTLKLSDTLKIDMQYEVVSNKGQLKQIVLVKDGAEKSSKGLLEHPLLISFIYSVLVTIITVLIVKRINKKKEKNEHNKITGEIEKLKTENANMKKAFQPIVISTLQLIQQKLVDDKIFVLKELVKFNKECFRVESYTDEEGNVVLDEEPEYLKKVFIGIVDDKVTLYDALLNSYGYLFPDHILNSLKLVLKEIKELSRSRTSYFNAIDDEDYPIGKTTENEVKDLKKHLDEAINLIRKDLHLDNTFIHEFIEQNKN